jgi:Signal transduction histidine kinase
MVLKRILVLAFIFCHVSAGRSQEPAITDSLAKVLKNLPSGQQKAELLFQYGDQLSVYDTAKAVVSIIEGLKYVKGNDFYEGLGYFYLGRVYMDFADTKAEAAFDTAIQLFNQVATPESYIYQSRAWGNKAVIAQSNGDNKTFINLFLEYAIPLAAKAGDSLRMADGYMNVALPFMNYDEYDKAIFYLNKSEALFKRLAPGDLRLVDVYTHLAKIYVAQDSLTQAGEHLRLASAVLKRAPESLYAPNYHTVESMYLIKRMMWEEAGHTIEKGLSVANKLKNRQDIRQLLYQKSKLLAAQQRWVEAKDVLLTMYNEGYIELILDKKQLFSDLATLETHMGNYKEAYHWMVKHNETAAEVYAQQTRAQIAGLEARYNYVQKEKELLVANEANKRHRVIAWFLGAALLLLLVAIYFWWRNRKQRIARQIKEMEQKQQIALGKALLEGEERERSRLARDLHDGLGGLLAGIKLNLSQMVAANIQPDKAVLEQTVERLGHSVNELRRIARNMMPESLLQSGLETALKDVCDEATLPGLKVSFRSFNMDVHYPAQVQVTIYRIVQELVYNAVKHAAASRIMVQCSESDTTLFITVEDDGKGFVPGEVPQGRMGLKNIRNRVHMLNGKMDIESSPEGTVINIELYVGQ